MLSSDALPAVDRRALIRAAILLVGGSIAPLSGAALAKSAAAKPRRFFNPTEFAIVADVADIIVPRTETPGAKDAGVPENLDAMMSNWASRERQRQFKTLVAEIGAAGFRSLSPSGRVELVRRFDAEKLKAADPVYSKFKELVLTLFYLSELGATKELRYELIPGKWEPWTEVATDTPAWAM